jgi:hypothetical protein
VRSAPQEEQKRAPAAVCVPQDQQAVRASS